MTYDDQLRDFALKLNQAVVIDDVTDQLAFLSRHFTFVGSKIFLKNEVGYCDYSFEKWDFASIYPFFEEHDDLKNKILLSEKLYYIGDNLTEVGLAFKGEDFFKLLDFLIQNIPEHYYFYSREDKWCLLIAAEAYIEYGEK